jgi:hypothetical protein
MAWLTWRQNRSQLLGAAGLLLLLAIAGLVTSLPIRAAYHRQALSSCLPPATRSGCEIIVNHFRSEFAASAAVTRYLTVLPALAGLFIGAPLLAREFEYGTFRLAWTQSLSRRRWVLSRTLLLAVATVAAAAVVSLLTMWWRRPFDDIGGRIGPGGFDIEGLVVPAYAFFALAVGILAGMLLRRTIAAMSLAVVVFVAIRVGVEKLARPHYLAPLHRTVDSVAPSGGARDWILENRLVDAVGRRISTAQEDLAITHAQHARVDPQDYLLSLGWRRAITYQPNDRFWTFQAIEMGVFVVLGALAVAATVALVRRTPA